MKLNNYLDNTDLANKGKNNSDNKEVGPSPLPKTKREKELKDKLSYYQSKEDLLNESKQKQQEMAGITLDKLQKYLPYQIKAQGLSGSGASESTMLQAHANYANTMADIENDHNARLNELAAYKSNDIQAIHDKYDAIEQQASNDAYNELSAGVQEMLDKYVDTDGKVSAADMDKVEAYIESNSSSLNAADKALLDTILEKYDVRTEDEQTAFDSVKAPTNTIRVEWDEGKGPGDDIDVYIGSRKYQVDTGGEASSATVEKITSVKGSDTTKGEAVLVDGKLYMYLKAKDGNLKWHLIEPRENSGDYAYDFSYMMQALKWDGQGERKLGFYEKE